LILSKLLVLSITKRWDTLLRCHTQSHMTRLYKCHTQSVQLNKHSVKKKEELYISKRQHRWWPPLLTALMWFFLTEQQAHSHWHCCCSHHLRWQWEHHCCIQNSEQCDHVTCSYCNTHQNVLMYNDISKECHTVCLTVDTINRNQHILTLNQNCIDVQQSMSSHLIWQNTKLYKQNIHTEQCKNVSCLRRVSVLSELLLINKENWIFISSHKSENSNVHIVKNENLVSCQLWDTYLYNTYIVVVVDVVAAELVVQELMLTYSIKKDFTYKSCEWRSWRRKKKKLYVRWGFITHFTDR
jgi:hypothetical protein